jgi:cholesterol transport system auxiliary component
MSFKPMVVVGAALIVSACSIGRPIPTATTYSIEPRAAAVGVPRAPHPERLRVDRVRVAAAYDTSALVYRLTDVRYAADPYHALLADPGPMLGNRITDWLVDAGLFEAVDGPGGVAPAPWVLEATVTELYGDFEPGGDNPTAVMSIRFTLVDEAGVRPRVAYERSLSKRIPLPHAAPEALVSGYGRALAEILIELTTELSQLALK